VSELQELELDKIIGLEPAHQTRPVEHERKQGRRNPVRGPSHEVQAGQDIL
jgi:hypothetical protein